jgi:hypothetical protein
LRVSVPSFHGQFSAVFITNIAESRFSAHTGGSRCRRHRNGDDIRRLYEHQLPAAPSHVEIGVKSAIDFD